MKKLILFMVLTLIFTLAGCGTGNRNVAHQEGNLIITNYSSYEIKDITVTHSGKTVSVSPEAIKDTQVCYFTIEPAKDYIYTVSFADHKGEEHSREFTNDFTEDAQILIAVRYDDNVWAIGYDR